ncbi:MAG: methyltransferase domain-containing protein [Chloroflexota bacterium]
MSQQYDLIADNYDISFQLIPYRLHIEAYSIFKLLGSVEGLSVLDLATGTGYYARELKRRGATRVVGVDIAAPMIQVAEMAEQKEPAGITYFAQDAATYRSDEPFDIVLAAYLLHYAPTYEQLEKMAQGVAANLKTGGRLVTYQLNPELSHEDGYYKQYGLDIKPSDPALDGGLTPFTVTMGGQTTPEIQAYRWNKTTIEKALTEAGLTSIQWTRPEVSDAGVTQYGEEVWQTYLSNPHCVLLEAVKA